MMIITPHPSHYFIYKSAKLWNTVRYKFKISDMAFSVSKFKTVLKSSILANQKLFDNDEWSCENFSI